jgi:hypothetical protein
MTTELQKPKVTFRHDGERRADGIQAPLPGELYKQSTDINAPPDHYTPLWNATDHGNPDHRELVAAYQGEAFTWVYTIAQNVWDDWFDFVDPATDEVLEEMDVVQERMRELRMKEALTRANQEERKHGWSVIYKVYSGNRWRTPADGNSTFFMGDPMAFSDIPVSPGARKILAVQPLPTIDVQMDTVDEWNQPQRLKYTSSVSEAGGANAKVVNVTFDASRCWIINVRPVDRSWVGMTSMESIWEVLYDLRQHLDSMTVICQKMGMGLLAVQCQGDISSTESGRMNDVLQAASKRRHIIYDPNVWTKFEYIAPELAKTGLPEQIDIAYGMLASGTGLPKTRWIGAQAGALEGSRTNLKIEYGVISQIQSSYEPTLRVIVEDLVPGQFRDYKIKWRLEYQQDPQEEAQVLATQASAIQSLGGIMTMEEIRKKLRLPGTINPEETVSAINANRQLEMSKELGKGMAAAAGGKPPEKGKAKPTQPSRADAYEARDQGHFTSWWQDWRTQGFGQNEMIRLCGMGKNTPTEWIREEAARHDEL